jgi:hypothetical protein
VRLKKNCNGFPFFHNPLRSRSFYGGESFVVRCQYRWGKRDKEAKKKHKKCLTEKRQFLSSEAAFEYLARKEYEEVMIFFLNNTQNVSKDDLFHRD